MMTSTTIARYQPGGDIHATLEADYGRQAADLVAAAAKTGKRQNVVEAITTVRNGPPRNDSTVSNFTQQILNDPLGAPLDAANKGIGTQVTNAVKALFRNPWVLLLLALLLFIQFGGKTKLGQKLGLA